MIFQKIFAYLFADPGVYAPAGLYSPGHFFLAGVTVFCIYEGLKHTVQKSYDEIRSLIRKMIVVLWCLEIIKIIFRIRTGNEADYDTWVPLYFCSITLYAGLASGFGSGWLQHIGDVFMASGGMIGGICFMLYPSSSLLIYPTFHFLSMHSFIYHGSMTFLGILMNRSGLVHLKMNELKYYAEYVGFFCMIALIMNLRFGCNLMFISKPFGKLLEIIYKILGPLYTAVLIIVQMTVPYLVIMWFKKHTSLLTRPEWYAKPEPREA